MSLLFINIVVLASSAVTIFFATAFMKTKWAEPYLIPEERSRIIKGKTLLQVISYSSAVSIGLITAFSYLFGDVLFKSGPWTAFQVLTQTALVLLIYDSGYYFLHRYLFHKWRPLMKVHAVHHGSVFPYPVDSLYTHPVENGLGLLLFFGSIYSVGPIHLYSYGLTFFLYSQMNVLVHSRLVMKGPLAYLGFLAKKHNLHHKGMGHGNFANLTPFLDWIFKTSDT